MGSAPRPLARPAVGDWSPAEAEAAALVPEPAPKKPLKLPIIPLSQVKETAAPDTFFDLKFVSESTGGSRPPSPREASRSSLRTALSADAVVDALGTAWRAFELFAHEAPPDSEGVGPPACSVLLARTHAALAAGFD